MKNKAYLKIEEGGKCCFCGIQDETLVKHHVRIRGTCGTSMKPSDFQTIIVCHTHHYHCHTGTISITYQTNKMIEYWKEQYYEKHGVANGIVKMGDTLWEGLK